jgi:hypothetical protein
MRAMIPAFCAVLTCVHPAVAADRQWQSGTWTEVSVKRQMLDFGPGASPFSGSRPDPSTRAMADVHTYVIETELLRLELQDVVQVNKRSVDAVVGQPVMFALDKKVVYVRNVGGLEHKLRLTKKTEKHKP